MCYPEITIILQSDIKFFIYKFVYVIQKVLLFYRAIAEAVRDCKPRVAPVSLFDDYMLLSGTTILLSIQPSN